MKPTKKRFRDKYFKRVAASLRNGQPLPRFYITKMSQMIERHFFIAYITGFRVWWYDQFDRWSELDYVGEHKRWHAEEVAKFEKLAGFRLDDFLEVRGPRNPRVPRAKRKPRKEKPRPPMHQIKDKDIGLFIIRMMDGTQRYIFGTEAFSFKGYEFFIYEDDGRWNVSDKTAGARVYLGYKGEGFERTIKLARKSIELHFDKYEAGLRKGGFI